MRRTPLTLDALNAADERAFVAALGFIFEGSPWVAARAWSLRPFADVDALHAAMCGVVSAAPMSARVELIRAHPVLGDRAVRAGTLTPASTAEQASAGLDRLRPEESAMFAELNAAYHARFAFPFVVCVRDTERAAILDLLRRRVRNDRATEVATALAEIAKIARLRLAETIVA